MKKEDVISYIVYALILIAAILTVVFAINPLLSGEDAYLNGLPVFSYSPVVYSIITIVISIIFGSILVEVGHVLGAKIGKYKIISVNILYFNFYKTKNAQGKDTFKFRFKSFDGLTGETIVMPVTGKDGKYISKPGAMIYLPNLLLALFTALSFLGYALSIRDTLVFAPLSLYLVLVFGIMLFYNIIPTKLDSITDGYQMKICSKKSNIPAFNESLRIRSCNILGIDPGETIVFDEVTDYTFEINLVEVYKLLAKNDYASAYKILNKMYKLRESLNASNKAKLIGQMIYILLIDPNNLANVELAKKIYYSEITSEEKRDVSNASYIETIRAYILISGILELSETEVQYATSRANSAYRKVESGRKDIETVLYQNALKLVKEKHPKWELVINNKQVEKEKEVSKTQTTSESVKSQNKVTKEVTKKVEKEKTKTNLEDDEDEDDE